MLARTNLMRGDTLVCAAVRNEAPDVKTFAFTSGTGRAFVFHPGQFITLDVPLPSGTASRCFTVASPPTRPERIELTVKAQQEDGATRWLFANMAPGGTIFAHRPNGGFCIESLPAEPLALISAGSGATPMMAMLRWLDDLGSDHPVHYLHVGRTEADLLFRAEVEAIAARRGSTRVTWLTTRPGARPDATAIARVLPGLGSMRVFACGPDGFRAAARAAHAAAGGIADLFHEESFSAADDAPAGAASTAYDVRVMPRGVTVAAGADETLLVALARAGIIVPSSCRQGVCATCRVRCRGESEMRQNGGLFDDEVEDGDVLACCTYARGPLEIEMVS